MNGLKRKKEERVVRVKDDEETLKLIERAKRGNSFAVQKLLEKYERLVRKVVRLGELKLKKFGIYYDRYDIENVANIGFVSAIATFDPTRGMKFSTYVFWWMRTSVLRYAMEQIKEFMKTGYDIGECKKEEGWIDPTAPADIIDKVALMNKDAKLCDEWEEFLNQRFGKGKLGKKDSQDKKEEK